MQSESSDIAHPFLTAAWRDLFMVSFRAEEKILLPYLPTGVEFDRFDGAPILSLVSFRFSGMKVVGIRVPTCQDFIQVNLRFYVRRMIDGEWRRGVVFIKEFCPSFLAGFGARLLYRENYQRAQTAMRSTAGGEMRASWRFGDRTQFIKTKSLSISGRPCAGTIEEFIIERYFGYSRLNFRNTAEFRVSHRPWNCRAAGDCTVSIDGEDLYGRNFASAFSEKPLSALVADGSEVKVGWRRVITRGGMCKNKSIRQEITA